MIAPVARVGSHLIALILAIAMAGCAHRAGPAAQNIDADGLARQIMVMVPSPPRVDLRPYDYGGTEYGAGHARNQAMRTARAVARERGIVVLDDWPMPALELHCIVARIEDGQDPGAVLSALNGDARIAWAQPMQRFRALNTAPVASSDVGAPAWNELNAMHRIATGRRVTIAQIDTGVDLKHPVLSGQWSGPRNFVDAGRFPAELHGTAVAALAVARLDSATGLVGVSPGARIVPLRACWESRADGAQCSTFTLAKALQHALRDSPHVINLSVTGPSDRLLSALIDQALKQRTVVVAAGDDTGGPDFPATHPQVLAVYGNAPPPAVQAGLQAPSRDILSATPNGTFAFVSGSSFSAAQVSGLTALVLELAPRTSPSDLKTLLRSTASYDGSTGVARIEPCAVLRAVAPRDAAACPSSAKHGNRP